MPFRYVSDPPFEHDVQLRVPDVRKAREVLGFEATTTLDAMLDEVIPWIRDGAGGRATCDARAHRALRGTVQRTRGQREGRVWREIVGYLSRGSIPTAAGPRHRLRSRPLHALGHARRALGAPTSVTCRGVFPADVRFVHASGLDLESRPFRSALRHDLHEQLSGASLLAAMSSIEQLRVAARLLLPVVGSSCCSRTFAGRATLLGLHRPSCGPDRPQPPRGRRAGEPPNRELVPRFLPYSTKGRLPTTPLLVRAYLRFRPAWRLLGKQTLYVGTPLSEMSAGRWSRTRDRPSRVQRGRSRRARPPGACRPASRRRTRSSSSTTSTRTRPCLSSSGFRPRSRGSAGCGTTSAAEC